MSSEQHPNGVRYALIGDLEASKGLPQRDRIQARLRSALQEAERAFPRLFSPLQVTGGDEFKVLAPDGRTALELASFLADRLHPVRVRFGIGSGALTVGRPGDLPGTMDGPVFHRAREAIDLAKRRDHWLVLAGHTGRHGATVDALVNASYALTGRIRARWTDTQRRYIQTVSQVDTQKEAARRLSVSPSTISESLRSADWHEVRDLEEEMKRLLDRYAEPTP